MGVVNFSGKALVAGEDRHHQVEAKEGEVGEVVLGEGLALEVGVNAAQPPQAAAPQAEAGEVGNHDLPVVSHDDMFHRPLAVDDNPQLAVDFPGALGQVAGQFRGDDLGRRDTAVKNPLQGLDLARLQAREVAAENHGLSRTKKGPVRGAFFQYRVETGRHIRRSLPR